MIFKSYSSTDHLLTSSTIVRSPIEKVSYLVNSQFSLSLISAYSVALFILDWGPRRPLAFLLYTVAKNRKKRPKQAHRNRICPFENELLPNAIYIFRSDFTPHRSRTPQSSSFSLRLGEDCVTQITMGRPIKTRTTNKIKILIYSFREVLINTGVTLRSHLRRRELETADERRRACFLMITLISFDGSPPPLKVIFWWSQNPLIAITRP